MWTFCDVARSHVSMTWCDVVRGAVAVLLLCVVTATKDPGPCLGCQLFNINRQKPEKQMCPTPCRCPGGPAECHTGVSKIVDGCGCCYMCARQQGDLCTLRDKCDVTKGIYCDRDDRQENSVGQCRVKESVQKQQKSCNVDGVVYQDGDTFNPTCAQICTCNKGFYGCFNRCHQEEESNKPSETTCHAPRLIKVATKCCREWTCLKLEANGSSKSEGMKSQNLVKSGWPPTISTSPAPITPDASQPCTTRTTSWTACSVTCDVGVIMRIVADPVTCQHVQEHKLCYLRPCGKNVSTLGRDKCTPTTRAPSSERVYYQDCRSVRRHRLRYCTTCLRNKCCYPKKGRTVPMKFECTAGVRKEFNFVKITKCRCDKVCYQKDRKAKRIRQKKRHRLARRRKKMLKKKKEREEETLTEKTLRPVRSRRRLVTDSRPEWFINYLKFAKKD